MNGNIGSGSTTELATIAKVLAAKFSLPALKNGNVAMVVGRKKPLLEGGGVYISFLTSCEAR